MTSTQNNLNIGDRVVCLICKKHGTVERNKVLGLSDGISVRFDDGMRKMFCGKDLKCCCKYIELFQQTLLEVGEPPEQVASFENAWMDNTSSTERYNFNNGLVLARSSNDTATIQSYLSTVKQSIGI